MVIKLENFGDSSVNGQYYPLGERNGKPYFQKDDKTFIIYHLENGPYSFKPGYYIVETFQVQGSIPIEKPLYRKDRQDVLSGEWVSLTSQKNNALGTTCDSCGESRTTENDDVNSKIWDIKVFGLNPEDVDGCFVKMDVENVFGDLSVKYYDISGNLLSTGYLGRRVIGNTLTMNESNGSGITGSLYWNKFTIDDVSDVELIISCPFS